MIHSHLRPLVALALLAAAGAGIGACGSVVSAPGAASASTGGELSGFQCFADVELACRAPSDACRSDADCADPAYPLDPQACALPFTAVWQCIGQLCSKAPPTP